MKTIDIALVHFGAVDLRYFDAAWYSLSMQDFTRVANVIVYDNSSGSDPELLYQITQQYPVPVPVRMVWDRHNDPQKKNQSYSVNAAVRATTAPWVFFTRSDYILDFSIVHRLGKLSTLGSGFITSYAYHMALDERADQRIEGFRDIEGTGWRRDGVQVLLSQVNGWKVDSSDRDAGVWLCPREWFDKVGGLDERLRRCGLQQTCFQQALHEQNCPIVQIPEFLFFHQHHGGDFRDYDAAIAELEQYWGPREKVRTFRDISHFVGKVNDETPRT